MWMFVCSMCIPFLEGKLQSEKWLRGWDWLEPVPNQSPGKIEPVPYQTVDITELRAQFYCPENCRHGLGSSCPDKTDFWETRYCHTLHKVFIERLNNKHHRGQQSWRQRISLPSITVRNQIDGAFFVLPPDGRHAIPSSLEWS